MSPSVLVHPQRHGVGASCVVLTAKGLNLLDAIAQRLPSIPKQIWVQRFAQGNVLGINGQAVNASDPCVYGMKLYYYRDVPNESALPFEEVLLYRDSNIIVADKPHFMPVVPSGSYLHQTLLVRLRRQLNLPDLTPVHRIDKDTAGLVLFCIHRTDRNAYQALFRQRQVMKKYLAVAAWRPDYIYPLQRQSRIVSGDPFFRCVEVPGEVNALTSIEVVRVYDQLALYRLTPVTGQRHQLRVHMQALGMPIVHDTYYPVVNDPAPGDFSCPLQLLAQELAFVDPITSKRHHFCSQQRLQLQAH